MADKPNLPERPFDRLVWWHISKISICSWSTIIETLCFMSQKICQIDFSWWIAPKSEPLQLVRKVAPPISNLFGGLLPKILCSLPQRDACAPEQRVWRVLEVVWRLEGGWMEVGWYWIVLEGEERGCGGVYHPWGNLILRRKPLQVSLNMPHTHIPSKHTRTKGGENFLVRFISEEKWHLWGIVRVLLKHARPSFSPWRRFSNVATPWRHCIYFFAWAKKLSWPWSWSQIRTLKWVW